MIYRPKKRKPRTGVIIITVLILLMVIALIAALIYWLRHVDNSEDSYVKIAGKGDGYVASYSDGFLVVDSDILICVDLSGKTLWQVNLPLSGMKAARYADNTVVWGGKYVLYVDKNGIMSQALLETTGDTVMCAVGKNNYAVVTIEDGVYRLIVYSFSGTEIDNERFPYQTVVAMDFYGADMSQLWVMAIDSHGTKPMTRLNTYQPGKTTSGAISSVDELGYYAVIKDKIIHLVGTHNLGTWEQPSTLKQNENIYGWVMQCALPADKGVSFLFAPVNEASNVIGALWYVNSNGEDVMVSLPAGCIKGIIGGKRLIAVHPNGYYSIGMDGTTSTFHSLDFVTEQVVSVLPGKAYIARSGHELFLVSIP